MSKCINCKKRLLPSDDGINICSFCGFAQGEDISLLSEVKELEQEDQYRSISNIQIMGRIALFALIALLTGVILYASNTPPKKETEKTVVKP